MNRQQIIHYQPQLKKLLQRLKSINLFLIAVVIILYSISIYCLLKEQMVVAISLATIAAIIFHLSQKYMLSTVTYWLSRNKENRAMFSFVESEIEKRKSHQKMTGSKKRNEVKEFFMVLEKALDVVES
jgi:uncharacterized membrane protein